MRRALHVAAATCADRARAHTGRVALHDLARRDARLRWSSSSSSSARAILRDSGRGFASAADLTHVDASSGDATMVDVGDKPITTRVASASAKVLLGKRAFDAVQKDGVVGKGNVLAVAQIAGINAAKRASSLIPLCHTLLLHKVSVDFTLHPGDHSVRVLTSAKTDGRTGVEMEALTAAAVAGLTVYDMCKALSKDIVLSDVRLESKSGGVNSGDYVRGGGGGGSS